MNDLKKLSLYFPRIDFTNDDYVYSLFEGLTNYFYTSQQRMLIIEYISNNIEFFSTLFEYKLLKKDNKGPIEILIDYYINDINSRNIIMKIFNYLSENIMIEQSTFNYIYFLIGKEFRENSNFTQKTLTIYLELLYYLIKNIGKKYIKFVDFFHFYSLNSINLIKVYPIDNSFYNLIDEGFGIQVLFYLNKNLINDGSKILLFENKLNFKFEVLLNNKINIDILINNKSELKNPFIIKENCWITLKILFKKFPSNLKLITLISCNDNSSKIKSINIPFFNFEISNYIFFERFKGKVGPIIFFNPNYNFDNICFNNKSQDYTSIDSINYDNIFSILSPKNFNNKTFEINDICNKLKGELPSFSGKESLFKHAYTKYKTNDNIYSIGGFFNILPIFEILINNPFNFNLNEEILTYKQIMAILKIIINFKDNLYLCEKSDFWKFFSIILERLKNHFFENNNNNILYDILIQIIDNINDLNDNFPDFFNHMIFNVKISNKLNGSQINNLINKIESLSGNFNQNLFLSYLNFIISLNNQEIIENILLKIFKNEKINSKNKFLLFIILVENKDPNIVEFSLNSINNFFLDIKSDYNLKRNILSTFIENNFLDFLITLLELYPSQSLKLFNFILNINFSCPDVLLINSDFIKSKIHLMITTRYFFYNYLFEIEESNNNDNDFDKNEKLNILIQIINNFVRVIYNESIKNIYIVKKRLTKQIIKEENLMKFFEFIDKCLNEQKFDRKKKNLIIINKFIRPLTEIAMQCFYLYKNENNEKLKEYFLKIYNIILIKLSEIFDIIDNKCRLNYVFRNNNDDKLNIFNLLTCKYFLFAEGKLRFLNDYMTPFSNENIDDNHSFVNFEILNNLFENIVINLEEKYSLENIFSMSSFIKSLNNRIIKEKKNQKFIFEFQQYIINIIPLINFFLSEMNNLDEFNFLKIIILIIYSGFDNQENLTENNFKKLKQNSLFIIDYFFKRIFLGFYLNYYSQNVILFIFNLIHEILLFSNYIDIIKLSPIYIMLIKYDFISDNESKNLIFDKNFFYNEDIIHNPNLIFNILGKKKNEIIFRCLSSIYNEKEELKFMNDDNLLIEKQGFLTKIFEQIAETLYLEYNINENKNNLIKKYRKLKKKSFQWNNSYSDLNVFYSLEGRKKLKFKNYYHLTKDLINPLIVPIIDIESYIHKFNTIPSNQIFQDDINNLYKINLKNNNLFYETLKQKHSQAFDCFEIKILSQIKGTMFILNQYIEFIQKKRKENEQISKKKNCYIQFLFGSNEESNDYYLKIYLNEIIFILTRKYYDCLDSIEIFTKNNKSYFFRFINEKSLSNFLNFISNNTKMKEKVYNTERIIYLEKYEYLFYENKLYQAWKERKITTLNYIIILNILSQRSFRDLTQYPFFPWLEFNKIFIQNSFKTNIIDENISKFILTANENLSKLKNLFKRSESVVIDIKNVNLNKSYNFSLKPPNEFYNFKMKYYSNLYSVSYYLTRTIPLSFSTMSLISKKFTLYQQLFINNEESFIINPNLNKEFREIVPEYYFFPELFLNLNEINLFQFCKCNPNILQKAELPNWCNKNSFIFSMVMREFLENSNLSINHWINAFFGKKQVSNEFLKLSYHSDIDNMVQFNEQVLEKCVKDFELGDNVNQAIDFICENIEFNENILNDLRNIEFKLFNSIIYHNSINSVNYCFFNDDNFIFINNNYEIITFKTQNNNIESKKNDNININLDGNLYEISNIFKNNERKNYHNKIILKFFNKRNYLISSGFYNGEIYLYDINNKNNTLINNPIKDFDNIITFIEIDSGDEYVIFGTLLGTIILYEIDTHYENVLTFKNFVKHHEKKIIYINCSYNLNLIIDSSEDFYINIYTIPDLNLVNSIKDYETFDYVFLSSSPLPSFVIYSSQKSLFKCYNINSFPLGIEQENLFKRNNELLFPLIYTDFNNIDYLIYIQDQKIFIRKFPFMNLFNEIDIPKFVLTLDNLFFYQYNRKIFIGGTEKNEEIKIYQIINKII